MTENRLRDSVAGVFEATFERLEGTAYVVNPTRYAIDDLVDVLRGLETPPTVRLLATEDVLKAAMEDFIVASTTADLVDSGVLSVRSADDRGGMVVVGENRVVSVVAGDGTAGGLASDDEELVAAVRDRYARVWEDAAEYTLRTPSISSVRETLAEELGDETAEDFDQMLASLGTARGDDDGLDEVAISLLVAAKNEELLYDVSKWGEDVGIASKATFSRTKTQLEELGLIDTEKVPIDVGRPRLRLLLANERLREGDVGQLASAAQSTLAGAS